MTFRKIAGALIVVLIGIPVLFGVTWAVGLVRASLSPEFLVDLPQAIIADIPRTADEIFRAVQDERIVADPETRAWFRAAAKTGTSPKDLLEKTGILAWMKGELSDSLRKLGEVLRGEAPVQQITIDMRPLKQALLHPEMDRFLEATLANLPPCNERDLKIWQDRASGFRRGDLPACRPDSVAAKDIFFRERKLAVDRMDDSTQVLEGIEPFPFHRFGFSKSMTLLSYLLFLFPALIILIGVLIANRSGAGRLRWSGISVLAGSLPVLVLAFGIKKFVLWGLHGGMFTWRSPWAHDIDAVVLDKLSWIPSRFFDVFFSPVIGVAAFVATAGIVLIALSYSSRPAVKAPTN